MKRVGNVVYLDPPRRPVPRDPDIAGGRSASARAVLDRVETIERRIDVLIAVWGSICLVGIVGLVAVGVALLLSGGEG